MTTHKQEMINYIKDFLEKPQEIFDNLPVCPFARQARVEDKIWYYVHDFSSGLTPFLKAILGFFSAQRRFDIFLCMHINKELALDKTYQFVNELKIDSLEIFGGHPNDPFTINGFRTRREPYPNFVAQRKEVLEKARDILRQKDKLKYYQPLVKIMFE